MRPDLRLELDRTLRDPRPDLARAAALAAQLGSCDHDVQLRRAMLVELEPELAAGCVCFGAAQEPAA